MKIISATLILLSLLTACNTKTVDKETEHEEHHEEGRVELTKQQQAALDLKLGTFQMRNLTTVVKINGQLAVAPGNKAEITAIVGGNVKQINVFNGDKVKKGEVLTVLEHPEYIKLQEEFAVIANSLEYLEQEYNRQKELYENKVGAGRDYQKAKSDYFTAKAKYQGHKSRLELLNISPEKVIRGEIFNTISIITPISGSITSVNIKLGTYVDAKDVMFEITDNSKIHADFMVYENDVHLVKTGQKIHFTVSNRPDEEFIANVFAIGEMFDPKTRAVHIHANISGNTSGLIPGMYITGHLHTNNKMVQTLPDDAIVHEGVKSYIFVVDNEKEEEHNNHNAYRMVEVITGKKDEGFTEINLMEELSGNPLIVLNNAYYLHADMNKEELEHEH